MERITLETLQDYFQIQPGQSTLERFIPGEGLTPGEFIKLPIDTYLGQENESTLAAIKVYLLLFEGVLPDIVLNRIGIYAARLVLPVYERTYPRDRRPRRAILAKIRLLRGRGNDAQLGEALAGAYAAYEELPESWESFAARACWEAASEANRAYWVVRVAGQIQEALHHDFDETGDAYERIYARLCYLIHKYCQEAPGKESQAST